MRSHIEPKLIGCLVAVVLIVAPSLAHGEDDSLGSLTASGKVKVETSGTGETIGHIADLKIQDLTDQPLTCAIPPMILESGSGKNQHYACPTGQTVALNPHQTKTVPMNGVCLNRNKPPVAKGVIGDLVMNEANPSGPQNPNSHLPATDAGKLLRSCAAKFTAADQLQRSGALKSLPYHDPQKQKDIVVQWSTWSDPQICQIVGTTPATKDDLKKVVYKQVEEQGPMSPATRKKVDQGIDTIFEKVELTTAKAKDLEKPGSFFEGPISTGKPGPLFQPATVAQPGDVVHVEEAPVGAKGHWMVKVKRGEKIVEVWFETDDAPPLAYCNYIKINKTGTSASGKNTVIEDYERTTPTPTPTPAPTPTPTATPKWKSYLWTPAPTPTPTATPKWKSFLWTPAPTATQSPRSPGDKTELEKPKGEAVKPAPPWKPDDCPDALAAIWNALTYAVTGSEFAGAVPSGKDALAGVINEVKKKILRNCAKAGREKECEYYQDLRDKLARIYQNIPDK
jgi:hypothetical protein